MSTRIDDTVYAAACARIDRARDARGDELIALADAETGDAREAARRAVVEYARNPLERAETPSAEPGCGQVERDYLAALPAIRSSASETLRDLAEATERLFDQHREWSRCQKTARRRKVLDAWRAEIERAGAPVPDGAEPVDLVVPVGPASKWGDHWELRMLLRSAQRNLRGLRKVWILGHRPEWLTGVEQVPIADSERRKSWNILRKFRGVLDLDTTETLVKSSDDQLFVRPVSAADWTVVAGGDLTRRKAGFWGRCHAATGEWLEAHGYPTRFYDTHVPCVLTRAGLRRWFEAFPEPEWKRERGWCVWSLFYNIVGADKVWRRSAKTSFENASRSETVGQALSALRRKTFAGYGNPGLTANLKAAVEQMFPEPSRFERPVPVSAPAKAVPASAAPAKGPLREFRWKAEDTRTFGDRPGLADLPPERALAELRGEFGKGIAATTPEHAAEIRAAWPEAKVEVCSDASAAVAAISLRARFMGGSLPAVALLAPGIAPAVRVRWPHAADLYASVWTEPPPATPDLSDVSFVVPICRLQDDPDRLASFRFVTERILETRPRELIVVEQLRAGQAPLPLPEGCTSVVVETDQAAFWKARLLNAGAARATGRRLWLNDSDCWLDFAAAAVEARATGAEAVKPFAEVWRIDAAATAEFCANGHARIARPPDLSNNWGGGSLLIARDAYTQVRGYNETFVGWGAEDTEFGERIRAALECAELSSRLCLHLHHGRDKRALMHAAKSRGTSNVLQLCRTMPIAARIQYATSPFTRAEKTTRPLPDVVCLVAVYGHNCLRAQAIAKAFEMLDAVQDEMPRIVAAWCYRAGAEPAALATMPDYAWLERVRLPEYDLDDGIFRKEALLNYLCGITTERYIVCLDAEVWCPDPRWFRRIRDTLAADDRRVFQPWRGFIDSREEKSETSWSAHVLRDKGWHPGLVWAFGRCFVDSHNDKHPFSAKAVVGHGDCVFVSEHFRTAAHKWQPSYQGWPGYQSLVRSDMPQGTPACIDVVIVHENHTDTSAVPEVARAQVYADRCNFWFRAAAERFGSIDQYIWLDPRGVPVARDVRGPFCGFLRRRAECQDQEAAYRVAAECVTGGVAVGLPSGDTVSLTTFNGIGDAVMLLGVVARLRRDHPDRHVEVSVDEQMEPWFRAIGAEVRQNKNAKKLVWLRATMPKGVHAIRQYGAHEDDISICVPTNQVPTHGPPRIAFVTQHVGWLQKKRWPHWKRLAALVKSRYGVDPLWIGVTELAKTVADLPALLASMDAVICTEGMGSHVCWAIRKRALVLVSGAVDPAVVAYPGFHTILRGSCPHGRFCDRYTHPGGYYPDCHGECMSSIPPEAVLSLISVPPRRRILNLHFDTRRGGRRNVGDMHAAVCRYFPNMEEGFPGTSLEGIGAVIFGGGGVYHPVFQRIARVCHARGIPYAIWGAGVVTELRRAGKNPFSWRDFGDMAAICGMRETNPWNYVPCPSCLSPYFEAFRDLAPTTSQVIYENPDKPIPDIGLPRMSNYESDDLPTILRFLASAEKVATSSYHGRLWATWLGRTVTLRGKDADMLSMSGDIPPLDEARRITRDFSEHVMKAL
jgi:hypothetical protein